MPEKDIKRLGNIIRQKRYQEKITQEELSERTGISKRHIAKIENGVANASFDIVTILARTLYISTDNIIFYDELEDNQLINNELLILLSSCTEEEKRFIINAVKFLIDELYSKHTIKEKVY
ncbi:MAG: helix-turn-helix transcriptional regulator [Faecalibacillus sp.]